ncbi:hypothetical protein [Teredinibacter sp. KSP-S5-2]|uniref:hypothetical protein n=1 Tax=Teredinibacter sp. KSP-S5-2 TaxID=3034506 RepID=UPI0029342FDA|nr:hypothetical protein [Teredinibacter sp. KSP-S5-2]WNO10503.1 hypothetical protein P5V12_04890 [Teredinibacter sp. KSP-S5-2]
MFEEKDIEVFLKAKKNQLAIDIFQVLSSLTLVLLVFLEAMNITDDYTTVLATISVVFAMSAYGKGKWISISRADLIKTIEQAINRVPEALRMLASKKGNSQ